MKHPILFQPHALQRHTHTQWKLVHILSSKQTKKSYINSSRYKLSTYLNALFFLILCDYISTVLFVSPWGNTIYAIAWTPPPPLSVPAWDDIIPPRPYPRAPILPQQRAAIQQKSSNPVPNDRVELSDAGGGGGRRAWGTLVWDAARSGFLPETCGLFAPSLNAAETERWVNEGSMEEGTGRPQSKLTTKRSHRQSSGGIGRGFHLRVDFLCGWCSVAGVHPLDRIWEWGFRHAIQSFLQISFWHQGIWVLFNPVV